MPSNSYSLFGSPFHCNVFRSLNTSWFFKQVQHRSRMHGGGPGSSRQPSKTPEITFFNTFVYRICIPFFIMICYWPGFNVKTSRFLCVHKILVHAQDSCACKRILCMQNTFVHAQDSCACTRFLCMHKNLVHL